MRVLRRLPHLQKKKTQKTTAPSRVQTEPRRFRPAGAPQTRVRLGNNDLEVEEEEGRLKKKKKKNRALVGKDERALRAAPYLSRHRGSPPPSPPRAHGLTAPAAGKPQSGGERLLLFNSRKSPFMAHMFYIKNTPTDT